MLIRKQNIDIPLFSCFYTFVLHILQVSLRRFTFYIFYQVSLTTLYIMFIFFVKRWYLKIYRQYSGFSRLTRLSTAYR